MPVTTILRTDGEEDGAVIDLFGLATEETAVGDARERPLWSRAWDGIRAVARAVPNAWHARKSTAAKSRKERQQMLYGSLALLGTIIGVIVMLGGLASAFATSDAPWLPRTLQGLILGIGSISIWKSKFLQSATDSAVTNYCVVDYLDRAGGGDTVLRGNLAQLIERICERDSVTYDRIVVLAYSFGALAAIDALFPVSNPPPPRLAEIDEMVTIGCPFDIVRTYWPDYFQRRFYPSRLPQWLNVYAPSDVLAANFRDERGVGQAEVPIKLQGAPHEVKPINQEYLIDGRTEPVGRVPEPL